MSTSAAFKFLVNDKNDRILLANKLLYQRIQEIMYIRSIKGMNYTNIAKY